MAETNFKKRVLKQTRIIDEFWSNWIHIISKKTIPYQWKALNDQIQDAPPSHSVENFRIAAGQSTGSFHGMPFQDSDVYKWIEAASYSLIHYPSKEIESQIDELVELIEAAQHEDGYINTYYTVAKPTERWTDFSHGHELYCAGHLIEAAVANYDVTGKEKLLSVVNRFVDNIDKMCGPEEGKRKVYPGHEEIELALIRLFKVTGNPKHLNLCIYFINERGKQPSFLSDEKTLIGERDRWFGLDYHQAHSPVREQTTAHGHAVRAMYLYTAMADIARETGDQELKSVLKQLWNDVTNQKMYITGGIGSQGHGERFTFEYDLPNDVAYAETCASIGLMFWAKRMMELENHRQYADVMETALYNGVLSGISLEGTKYFYVNPLEVLPEAVEKRFDHKHVEPERVPWFGCACCPPNIARLITSIGQYIYTTSENRLNVHLYIGSETKFDIGERTIEIVQKTNYPSEEKVLLQIQPEEPTSCEISLRIPSWCKNFSVRINDQIIDSKLNNNGYIILSKEWKQGDNIELELPLVIEKVRANPRVRENVGKITLKRGPIVYCLEQEDNGSNLKNIFIPRNNVPIFSSQDKMGTIECNGVRYDDNQWDGQLYSSQVPQTKHVKVKAVPYFSWGNRSPREEMLVWINEM